MTHRAWDVNRFFDERNDPRDRTPFFLSWWIDYDNEMIDLSAFILRESTYAVLRPHRSFRISDRSPPTHCPALIATVVHTSLYIRKMDQQSRAYNSRKLARYNKYNNNVYLLLHLYFTLFRLWLTNRYLIVVWTALVISFFLSAPFRPVREETLSREFFFLRNLSCLVPFFFPSLSLLPASLVIYLWKTGRTEIADTI